MVDKITELEDRLFTLDQEYEAQTDKFKKQYDQTMKIKLEENAQKAKQDFNFRLQIRLDEQKQEMLTDKFNFIQSLSGPKEEELVGLRLKQSRISDDNDKLGQALEDAKKELDELRVSSNKKGWWIF
jgi:hypothetical protein